MHDLHIRNSDIRAGYAFPRGPGLPHSGALASKRGKETQDYRGEMNVPSIRAVAPIIEKMFGRKGCWSTVTLNHDRRTQRSCISSRDGL